MKMLHADLLRKRHRHVTQKAACQHISCSEVTGSPVTMPAQFLGVTLRTQSSLFISAI